MIKIPDWEERFDKQFLKKDAFKPEVWSWYFRPDTVKAFISTLLEEQKEEIISRLETLAGQRHQQHSGNLELWRNGALRPTVEDDSEAQQVMEGLKGAMNEDQVFLEELDQLKKAEGTRSIEDTESGEDR